MRKKLRKQVLKRPRYTERDFDENFTRNVPNCLLFRVDLGKTDFFSQRMKIEHVQRQSNFHQVKVSSQIKIYSTIFFNTESRRRIGQTSRIGMHARLFQHCDIQVVEYASFISITRRLT